MSPARGRPRTAEGRAPRRAGTGRCRSTRATAGAASSSVHRDAARAAGRPRCHDRERPADRPQAECRAGASRSRSTCRRPAVPAAARCPRSSAERRCAAARSAAEGGLLCHRLPSRAQPVDRARRGRRWSRPAAPRRPWPARRPGRRAPGSSRASAKVPPPPAPNGVGPGRAAAEHTEGERVVDDERAARGRAATRASSGSGAGRLQPGHHPSVTHEQPPRAGGSPRARRASWCGYGVPRGRPWPPPASAAHRRAGRRPRRSRRRRPGGQHRRSRPSARAASSGRRTPAARPCAARHGRSDRSARRRLVERRRAPGRERRPRRQRATAWRQAEEQRTT